MINMSIASLRAVGGGFLLMVDGIVMMVQMALVFQTKGTTEKHNGTTMIDNKSE